MSFSDRLMLWFHVAFAVFTIGPVTLAIMSSPRAIRRRDAAVLRYLLWMTRIFGAATLGVFAFGMVLGQSLGDLGKAWLTVSMTLFVVAIVLLLLIMRDQRRALAALGASAKDEAPLAAAHLAAVAAEDGPGGAGGTAGTDVEPAPEAGSEADDEPASAADLAHLATVERGRIASLGGVVSLIWLAILVLMIWNS